MSASRRADAPRPLVEGEPHFSCPAASRSAACRAFVPMSVAGRVPPPAPHFLETVSRTFFAGATLRSALNDARREGLVNMNVATDAQVPRAERPKVHPWEPAELGTFLDHAGSHRLGPLYEIIALAALRRGEACGLRWSDVDLEQGHLVVRQQLVQLDGQTFECSTCGGSHRGSFFGSPKTSSGDARRVDLGQRGVGVLLAQRLSRTRSGRRGEMRTSTTTSSSVEGTANPCRPTWSPRPSTGW